MNHEFRKRGGGGGIDRTKILALALILIAAVFRVLVGPGKRRGRVLMLGTVGGLSFGVLVASFVSPRLGRDISAICACVGMVLGWTVSWRFSREIPRQAV